MKIFNTLAAILLMTVSCFAEDRVHTGLQLFINNHSSDPTNGCTTGVGEKGDVTCGHAIAVSRVVWKYLKSDSTGDKYEFTRHLVSNSKNVSSNTITVVYKGDELELWKDSKQKILIRPIKGMAKRAVLSKEISESLSGKTGTPKK